MSVVSSRRIPALRSSLVATLALAGATMLPAAMVAGEEIHATKTSAPAKVMLLLDTSLSMDHVLLHMDYDPSVTLTGTFDSNATYEVDRTKTYTPRSFAYAWPGSPSATLVCSDNGRPGLYPGNYLNWIFYHASDVQRAELPSLVRLQLAKTVLSSAVYYNPDLDFGLTIFNGNDGGRVLARCGTSPTTVFAAVAGITSDAGAPLAEALEDVLREFLRFDAQAPFVEPGARGFCLVLAGGPPTMDLDVSPYLQDADGDGDGAGTCTSLGTTYPDSLDCSAYLDDVAWYLARNDLGQVVAGSQNVITSVVSLLVDHPLLAKAAAHGGGDYYFAEDYQALYPAVEAALAGIRTRLASIADAPGPAPAAARLHPVCPNPFNPMATVSFELAAKQRVRLTVNDAAGRALATLADADFEAGRHELIWNGRLENGRAAPSGVYFFRMDGPATSQVLKAALLK